MTHLSDFDLRQMDDAWQDKQPAVVVRSLLKRTLDDLRVARDRLNQNPKNSSRPSGSMPPWQGGTDTSKDNAGDPDASVDILDGVYATGKKAAADFVDNMRIISDKDIPQWNYCAVPQQGAG